MGNDIKISAYKNSEKLDHNRAITELLEYVNEYEEIEELETEIEESVSTVNFKSALMASLLKDAHSLPKLSSKKKTDSLLLVITLIHSTETAKYSIVQFRSALKISVNKINNKTSFSVVGEHPAYFNKTLLNMTREDNEKFAQDIINMIIESNENLF